jgi:KipI family sensor histidine kinase inhibitor
MRFQPASDCSLLVYFGEEISLDVHRNVTGLLRSLEQKPFAGQLNLHPAYHSLLIVFDGAVLSHADVEAEVRGRAGLHDAGEPRTVEIPVHYDGPDLADVARLCGLRESDVVALHAGAEYLVYFVGFVPGFAYLGGLPEELTVARLESPRKRVAAGSVGIAGNQTGIYPIETPGGWRLIGHTDLKMFDGRSLLETGDHVRFRAVD